MCRLMLRMLSLSTGSESLRPRHVLLVSCESDAKSYGCATFTCALCVLCCCDISASACISAGPLSLQPNSVYTFVITSGCTDCPLRTKFHMNLNIMSSSSWRKVCEVAHLSLFWLQVALRERSLSLVARCGKYLAHVSSSVLAT